MLLEIYLTIGIAAQQLSDVENGRTNVSPAKAKEYALKLGESPVFFVKQAIQDILNKEGLDVVVDLKAKKKK